MIDKTLERLATFMAATGKESMYTVNAAIAYGLNKQQYMMAMEAMWDMCPLNKDTDANECD